eukprot:TRINITY_DN5041_c0_g1_i2.p1 TRINITY_DN5041_c0_g1~~TRINITY_DN5041_c0_g1_i2.p1  ORF type:complete len:138 (-),score=18.80 TRINITY_DN5041_c0_g1_i2:21-434(-)
MMDKFPPGSDMEYDYNNQLLFWSHSKGISKCKVSDLSKPCVVETVVEDPGVTWAEYPTMALQPVSGNPVPCVPSIIPVNVVSVSEYSITLTNNTMVITVLVLFFFTLVVFWVISVIFDPTRYQPIGSRGYSHLSSQN